MRISAWLLLLGAAAAAAASAANSPLPSVDYTVAGSWPLGGSGGWDYLALDPKGARLFVSRGERVDVVQTSSGKIVGTIADTHGVHGIAFAPALNRGFTSNGASNSVTVFELDTLRVLREVPVTGKRPDAILYDPDQNHLITANAASANLTVFDASTLQILATVALPGAPEFMATFAGTVYINIETEQGKLVALDDKALSIKAVWPLPGCSNPTGLAADPTHQRLFSVCASHVMAITDALTGKQVARPGIGAGPDAAAFDADLGLAFSSNGADGTLSVIREESPDEFKGVASVTTQVSARTMALDPATHKIYFAAAKLEPAPAATAAAPHPRPGIVSGSFVILIAQPK